MTTTTTFGDQLETLAENCSERCRTGFGGECNIAALEALVTAGVAWLSTVSMIAAPGSRIGCSHAEHSPTRLGSRVIELNKFTVALNRPGVSEVDTVGKPIGKMRLELVDLVFVESLGLDVVIGNDLALSLMSASLSSTAIDTQPAVASNEMMTAYQLGHCDVAIKCLRYRQAADSSAWPGVFLGCDLGSGPARWQ